MTITDADLAVLRKVQRGQVGWDPDPKRQGFTRRNRAGLYVRYEATDAQLRELVTLWRLKKTGLIAPTKHDVPGPVALTEPGLAELPRSAPTSQDRRPA